MASRKESYYLTSNGWKIRTALWLPDHAHSAVVLVGGRGDFIEKYAELMNDLLKNGFAVATFDWRGQGLSGRTTAVPYRSYISNFDILMQDFIELMQNHFSPQLAAYASCGISVLAHSMGGLVTLMALHAQPGFFERTVLMAPMCGIKTGFLPTTLVRQLAKVAISLGQGEHFIPGQGPYGPAFRAETRQVRLTSDIERFAQEAAAIDVNPELALGGITYGWLNAAFKAFEELKLPGFAENILCPMRIFAADHEQLVDNRATYDLARRVPNAEISMVSGAAHEIYRERDTMRTPVLRSIFAFLKPQAA